MAASRRSSTSFFSLIFVSGVILTAISYSILKRYRVARYYKIWCRYFTSRTLVYAFKISRVSLLLTDSYRDCRATVRLCFRILSYRNTGILIPSAYIYHDETHGHWVKYFWLVLKCHYSPFTLVKSSISPMLWSCTEECRLSIWRCWPPPYIISGRAGPLRSDYTTMPQRVITFLLRYARLYSNFSRAKAMIFGFILTYWIWYLGNMVSPSW